MCLHVKDSYKLRGFIAHKTVLDPASFVKNVTRHAGVIMSAYNCHVCPSEAAEEPVSEQLITCS